MSARRQVRAAMLVSWWVASVIGLGLLLVPFAISQPMLARVIPPCERRAQHQVPCPLCGMTTAFYLLAGGDFRGAARAHPASLPLAGLLAANGLAALAAAASPRFREPIRLAFQETSYGNC